jgi:hypothetical protein
MIERFLEQKAKLFPLRQGVGNYTKLKLVFYFQLEIASLKECPKIGKTCIINHSFPLSE